MGQNLQRADLRFANLRGSNLREADLSKAHLNDANLIEANLNGVNFSEANLSGAIISGADLSAISLREANLCGADLREADLREADLGGANLRMADLRGANLQRAILSDTDMENSKTVGTIFGMSDLSGAELPDSINNFTAALRSAEESSKNARSIYFSVLILCAFAILTVATTQDSQLILNTFRLKLPILNVDLKVLTFYIFTPILGLLVFVYFQMYLTHLWEVISDLPAYFPDRLRLRRKLYPWMINLIIEEWQQVDPATRGWQSWLRFERCRAAIAILLAWWLFPLTVGGLAYRFLVREDELVSYGLLGVFVLSVALASIFHQKARATVRNEKVGRRWWFPVLLSAGTLVLGLYGTQLGFEHVLPGTTLRIVARGQQLTGLVVGEVNLSGGDFTYTDFTRADLRKTNLTSGTLLSAIFTEAQLDEAIFFKADLREAILHKASLRKANLREANLSGANLEGANLSEANLQHADLRDISFKGADISGADISGANLSKAKLKEVKNWEDKQLASIRYWNEETTWPIGFKVLCETSTKEHLCKKP